MRSAYRANQLIGLAFRHNTLGGMVATDAHTPHQHAPSIWTIGNPAALNNLTSNARKNVSPSVLGISPLLKASAPSWATALRKTARSIILKYRCSKPWANP